MWHGMEAPSRKNCGECESIYLGLCQVMCCHWTEASCDGSAQVTDKSIPFMPRTEVIDVRSGAHLGHVFNGASLSSVM